MSGVLSGQVAPMLKASDWSITPENFIASLSVKVGHRAEEDQISTVKSEIRTEKQTLSFCKNRVCFFWLQLGHEHVKTLLIRNKVTDSVCL